MTWLEAPAARPESLSDASRVGAAWALSALPLFVQFHRQFYPFEVATPILIGLLLAILSTLLLRGWACVVPVIGIAAMLFIIGDRFALTRLAPVIIASGVLWTLATGAVDYPGARIRPPIALRPALPVLIAADLVLLIGTGIKVPLVLFVLAGLIGVVNGVIGDHGVSLASRLDRLSMPVRAVARRAQVLIEQAAGAFGRFVGGVAMVPATAFISVTWAAHRVCGYDPLETGPSSHHQWVRRHGSDPAPDRLYPFVAPPERRTLQRSLASLTAALLVAGATVSGVAVFRHFRDRTTTIAAPPSQRTLRPAEVKGGTIGGYPDEPVTDEGVPEDPRVYEETAAYVKRARFDPATTYRIDDFAGTLVNVKNGVRRTWAPPPGGTSRPLRVWWYGGSAAWGYTQRDLYSLPSQIAREAWRRGIALEIENRATPGWVFGQSVRDFAQRTSNTDQQPDVVVFYDGGNDVARQFDRAARGAGNDDSEISWLEATFDDIVKFGPFEETRRGPATTTTIQLSDWLDPRILGRRTVQRYNRDAQLARTIAEATGVAPFFVLQPLSVNVPDKLSTSPMDHGEADVWRAALAEVRSGLPADAVDLSTSLDGATQPVFKDLYHNNEPGAEIVAAAFLDKVGPALRLLSAAPVNTTTTVTPRVQPTIPTQPAPASSPATSLPTATSSTANSR